MRTGLRPTPSIAVAIAALVFAFAGSVRAQVPNPLPLQNPPPPPQRVNVQGTGGQIATATCPSGYQLVGGGGFGPGGLLVSWPDGGSSRTTWFVQSVQSGARAIAICERP
jgi:hypothetical protein